MKKLKKGNRRVLHIAVIALLLFSVLLQTACSNEELVEAVTTAITEATTTASSSEEEDIGTPKQYKTIFNSDTTHIMQCASPYHATNSDVPLTKKMVESAVTEALDAGADCYVITPGHCWVPWWPSEYISEHADWYFNTLGGQNASNPFYTYVHVKGQDFIQQQIDVCRKNGAGVFIDFRLNDAHMVQKITPETANIAFAAEIFVDHPEYKIGSMSSGRNEQVLDFTYEAVREHKLKYIKELIENYEIDGFELDFCRRFAYFNTDKTSEARRIQIMTDFVAEVRSYLDEATAKDGRYRHLSVRIPIWDDYYSDMGISLEKFEEAGVTIFNFTSSYFMDQDFNLKELAEPIKDAYVYCELHFITAVDYEDNGKRIHRRSTVEQFYTTALQAYEQGADGISFFNFQYYRGDRQGTGDEPLTEPPWEVISNVESLDFLKKQAQYYYFGQSWGDMINKNWKITTSNNTLRMNVARDFSMYLVAPEGGWTTDGVFRLQSLNDISDRTFTITVNGTVLQATAYTGEAYQNEYTQMIGEAENYSCFTVPKSILKEGKNEIKVTLTGGPTTVGICFVDLTIK